MIDPTLPLVAGAALATSKPLCRLIEAVSEYVTVRAEPKRTVANAKAETTAMLIYAQADIDRDDLARRTAQRIAAQEMRRQQNIESIVGRAIEVLPEEGSAEPADPDWMASFFDHCKDVSNEELHGLWAKLLSQEVTTPGSCHPSTLACLRGMTAGDAERFAIVASGTVSHKPGQLNVPVALAQSLGADVNRWHLHQAVVYCAGLGLVTMTTGVSARIRDVDSLSYDSRSFKADAGEQDYPCYPLTAAGRDLYAVVAATFDPHVVVWIQDDMEMTELGGPPDGGSSGTRRLKGSPAQ